MKQNVLVIIAIAVVAILSSLTAMAGLPSPIGPEDIFAIRPIIPDERTGVESDKKVAPKTRLNEIDDFRKTLKPLQDAAHKGDILRIRKTVNTLVERSDSLNNFRLPENRKARDFIKARNDLQKSVRELSKACQKSSNDHVISGLNKVSQKYQKLQKVVE